MVAATGGGTFGGILLTRPEAFVVAVTILLGVRAALKPYALPGCAPSLVVTVGVLGYLLAMGFIVITRHLALRTHALDLGQYVQTVWAIGHGYGATSTLIPEYVASVRMHSWGDHFSPILYTLVPFVRLVPDAIVPLLFQTIVLALGAVAVFLYAARHAVATGERAATRSAAALAIVYLLNPSLHGINLRDIHPAAFAIPLMIGAAAAHDARRYVWCALAIVATAACREDAAVAVVGFGIWLALARGRWAAGAGVAIAAVILLWLDLQVIMPYFREGAGGYHHLYRYAHLGGNLGEILVSIALRPWRWIGVLLTAPKLVYLLALLAPLAFLPLLAPRALAAALPGLAMNILSVDPILINHRSQYQSFVVPFLILAMVDGSFVLRQRTAGSRIPGMALGAAACLSLILTSRTFNDFSIRNWRPGPDQYAAHGLMARIPAATAVSANERLVPHLVMRENIFVYPRGMGISTHILDRADVLAKKPAPGYAELARAGGWILLERK